MLDKNNGNLLDELIQTQIEALKEMEVGTPEYEKAAESLAKLYKVRADEVEKQDRLDMEDRQHGDELVFKEEEVKTDKLHRWLRIGVDAGGVVLPLATYALCFWTGLNFEKTGIVTSFFGKQNLAQIFRPRK